MDSFISPGVLNKRKYLPILLQSPLSWVFDWHSWFVIKNELKFVLSAENKGPWYSPSCISRGGRDGWNSNRSASWKAGSLWTFQLDCPRVSRLDFMIMLTRLIPSNFQKEEGHVVGKADLRLAHGAVKLNEVLATQQYLFQPKSLGFEEHFNNSSDVGKHICTTVGHINSVLPSGVIIHC